MTRTATGTRSDPKPFYATLPAGVRKAERVAFVPAPAWANPLAGDPAEVVALDYTEGQLSAAFGAIQNPDHWKLPIGPVAIPADLLGVASAAAEFYAGAPLTVDAVTADRWAIVSAPGYYATIGA